MTRRTIKTLILSLLFTFHVEVSACEHCAARAPAASNSGAAKSLDKDIAADRLKKYEKTANAVWKKLLKNAKPVPGMHWPPELRPVEFIDFGNGRKSYDNACARLVETKDGMIPVVEITHGYLETFEGNEDVLALVLGHELGHHALGHTRGWKTRDSTALSAIKGHRREADADRFGAKLMLKAGYSLRVGAHFYWRGMERMDGLYSAAKGTCVSHPGTADRLARLFAFLDKGEEELWRCMSAFENGVTFLEMQNYAAAEACFLRVTKEFPKCHEAWTNLGLARLMRYCDGLDAEDVRLLEVGHFLGSGYPTAGSIVRTRGNRANLWHDAVNALMNAKELKPDSPLVLANLALAYLLHPAGKDVGRAGEFRELALAAFEKATDLPARVRVGMLVNFAVIHMAGGDMAKGGKMLAEAAELAVLRAYGTVENWPLAVRGAMAFNTAVALKETDRSSAIREFEKFLNVTPRSNPWWLIAYEQYEVLCQTDRIAAKTKTGFGNKTPVRMHKVVALKTGGHVHIGQPVDEALKVLGKSDRETPIPGAGVCRLHFDTLGFYLIADEDEVYAVVVTATTGPAVVLQEFGPGGKTVGEIRVGMTRAQVKSLPGRCSPTRMGFLAKNSDGSDVDYDYYLDLGVAVLYDSAGIVNGLLIGQLVAP